MNIENSSYIVETACTFLFGVLPKDPKVVMVPLKCKVKP